MKRQEKISLLVEKLGDHGFNKNSARHLNVPEIDILIEFLKKNSLPVNKRARPRYLASNALVQNQYREEMVNYIKEWGLELPFYLSARVYEAIADYCEPKQVGLTTTL